MNKELGKGKRQRSFVEAILHSELSSPHLNVMSSTALYTSYHSVTRYQETN